MSNTYLTSEFIFHYFRLCPSIKLGYRERNKYTYYYRESQLFGYLSSMQNTYNFKKTQTSTKAV